MNELQAHTPATGGHVTFERLLPWCAVVAALAYPHLLNAFYRAMGTAGGAPSVPWAVLMLGLALLVPFAGFAVAWRADVAPGMRRLSYAVVAAPTLYVFMGVLTYMGRVRISDEIIWTGLWLMLAGIAAASAGRPFRPEGGIGRWRVVHGVTAAVVVAFILFHLGNHLVGLFGFPAHDAVRKAGEIVYRQPLIEPVLALLLVFQTITGLRLFWRWGAAKRDFYRAIQAATGIYLAAYVIGHMDSVFVFARSWLDTTTSFFWAAGGAAGLLHDPWNVRLIPHYFFGAFCVLVHLACGARGVALAHGARVQAVNRLWRAGVVASLAVATLIMLAMTGTRI